MTDATSCVVVDMGGTQTRAALCDAQGQILRRAVRPTPASQSADQLMRHIEEAIEAVWPSQEPVRAIGVATPGPLDPWTGTILHSPNIPGWDNFPLRQTLQDRFGAPVVVADDANAAALAEHRFGTHQRYGHLIFITISTGVGSGIIVDNRLLLGAHGLAAELGHMTLQEDSPIQCGCGSRGCLESLISGPSLAEQARQRLLAGEASQLTELCHGDPATITASLVGAAALNGDALAIELFHRAGYYLGVALTNLLYILNPEIIIVGGSVSKVGPLLLDPARAVLRRRCMDYYWKDTPIVPSTLGDDVGLLGAWCLVNPLVDVKD